MVRWRDCIKTIIPIPLLSVVLMFCSVHLLLKGVDFMSLNAYMMFLVVVSMYC